MGPSAFGKLIFAKCDHRVKPQFATGVLRTQQFLRAKPHFQSGVLGSRRPRELWPSRPIPSYKLGIGTITWLNGQGTWRFILGVNLLGFLVMGSASCERSSHDSPALRAGWAPHHASFARMMTPRIARKSSTNRTIT